MTASCLLDTNIVSAAISGRSAAVIRRLTDHEPGRLCVSAISYGEIWFGLHRRPEARRLRMAASDFFAEVQILDWDRAAADCYARLRSEMERQGKTLSALDMLIAAHALQAGVTLVTSDKAFLHVPGLTVENWLEG